MKIIVSCSPKNETEPDEESLQMKRAIWPKSGIFTINQRVLSMIKINQMFEADHLKTSSVKAVLTDMEG